MSRRVSCKRLLQGVRSQLQRHPKYRFISPWARLITPSLSAAQLITLLVFLARGRGGAAVDREEGAPPSGGSIIEQHVSSSPEFSWSKPEDGKCPQWLADYVAFHRRMRGTENATYLVNTCSEVGECQHGIGDRVRGLLPTIQLAAYHNRVLLIYWPQPVPLERFFLPAQINWTVTPDLGIDVARAARTLCCSRDNFLANQPEGDGRLNRVWRISTNALLFQSRLDPNLPKTVPTFARMSWASHCFVTALFQPSQALKEATDEQQLKLMGSLNRPFVAVHMRMGHLEGESSNLARGWDHFQGLLAAYQCARKRNHLLHSTLDLSNSSLPANILLLTDHSQLRTAVATGILAGVTGPDYLAFHLTDFQYDERTRSAEPERVSMTTYVDLMLLARAHCLVWSKSGFPMVAMTMGFNPCTIDMPACIREASPARHQHLTRRMMNLLANT